MTLVQKELQNAYIGIPYPESISLDKNSINLTTIGQTEQLTATLTPDEFKDATITWTSSDNTIATVSSSGLVTCVTPGECTITATTVNSLTATCGVINQQGWQPGENTLLYLPLESDVVDQSGQATTRVFTTSSLSYTTVGGVPSVHIGSTGGIKLTTPYPLVPKTDIYPCTVSVLVYTTNTNTNRYILDMAASNGNRQGMGFRTTNVLWMSVYNDTNDSNYVTLETTLTPSQWNHIVYTITTTSSKLYVNGVLVDSGVGNPNYPRGNWPYSHDNTQGIFSGRDAGNYVRGLNGNARELIFEKAEWTAQEVADYYTQIKSKLGI